MTQSLETNPLFREDAYLKATPAKVIGLTDEGGVILDQTVFYATSGGQPGDSGLLRRTDGSIIQIATTVNGATKNDFIHVPAEGETLPQLGEELIAEIDWERRFKLMQMHTACHLLSVICPFPVTGASVNIDDSRIDFDMQGNDLTKEQVSEKLMEMVNAASPVTTNWISDEELAANPDLVKSKNVRPPVGQGRIRLVLIGDNGSVDSQPCGGTHVANTSEIGEIHIGKVEKKGKENRRYRIRFGKAPA
ncbi:alanyl-tRNA editing protein [Pseudochrobactrum algeriensis]|uniref:alanyl-tRNA editing protein n=1 Tax=Pseudochrobactrum algeriensis TaxID=2834768 RepID=UPI001BD04B35|nr:alanyl-tRNA editing protein [Pseudochrobactrum algeriensis]MBX8811294.1 alanyl-tRNA editing protein [Ochrobactrum sp. MR34]QVQ38411.1 alanyl-tRNA editing protein [Pseudochrobactrum algeriensis]QVQ41629.1 alanyl-tRNA editing protein [Pseudochrobactrum algeriensis]QVQ45556.1 alanyl-tRNA editing protein [Pseudochrobactrum algeriensis]